MPKEMSWKLANIHSDPCYASQTEVIEEHADELETSIILVIDRPDLNLDIAEA